MKKVVQTLLTLLIVSLLTPLALAGPYPPAAGKSGSTAIYMNDPSLGAWATGWVNYTPGSHLDDKWKTPGKALGKAKGGSYDVVCLGRGGSITLTFKEPISDGDGWDFAIFENAFNDFFLELAYVEVSANGTNFVRFQNRSLTSKPVSAYGELDPTDVDGLAGKYRQGYGTPFDLADVGLSSATHVRIVDIIGDGDYFDSVRHVIYDPYPTSGSAGFDLDAVGVITHGTKPSDPPTVTTSNADSIKTDSARLRATVNPNGSSTSYYFQYGPTSSYGSKTAALNAGQGTAAVSVSRQVTALDENTTYHFRVVAQNSAGVTYGNDKTFKTNQKAQQKPTVTTANAGDIATNSAVLNATVNPNGSSTSYYFQYGPTSSYGSKTAALNAGQGTAAVSVSRQVTALDENTTYHFRVVAQNSVDVTYGNDKTFRTTGHQAPLLAPTLDLTVSGNKVSLQWSSVSGATGYCLCVADPRSKWTALWDWGPRTSVSVTLPGRFSYYVSVIPYNAEGTGDASNAVHVETAEE